MLFRRVRVDLVLEHVEPANQLQAGLPRVDDLIDVSQLGRPERIRKLLAVLGRELGAPLIGQIGAGDFVAIDDVDGPVGAHHGDLGGRPGEIEIGANVLRRHDVVGAAVSLARDNGQLRDRGLGERVEQLGAVKDDSIPFLRGAG